MKSWSLKKTVTMEVKDGTLFKEVTGLDCLARYWQRSGWNPRLSPRYVSSSFLSRECKHCLLGEACVPRWSRAPWYILTALHMYFPSQHSQHTRYHVSNRVVKGTGYEAKLSLNLFLPNLWTYSSLHKGNSSLTLLWEETMRQAFATMLDTWCSKHWPFLLLVSKGY